jgi:hypothetical protein
MKGDQIKCIENLYSMFKAKYDEYKENYKRVPS